MGRWSEFEVGLREADTVLAREGMPADLDRDLRRRLREARRDRPGRRLRLSLATGLALAAAVSAIVVWRLRDPAAAVRLGGFEVTASAADLRTSVEPDGTVDVASGTATLADPPSGTDLEVAAGARLRREATGIRVVRGTVRVRVSPRPPGAPARLLVSHGQIEVLGTRFHVDQGPAGGQVFLEEGRIRFLREGGEAVILQPGQSLAWPEAPRPEPTAAPPPPEEENPEGERPEVAEPEDTTRGKAHRVGPAPPLQAGDLPAFLEEIAVLRSRGRYREASEELARRLRTADGAGTRERLSYELGSILSYQLEEPVSACKHWRRHLREFRPGRYRAEVRQAKEHSRCRGARTNP